VSKATMLSPNIIIIILNQLNIKKIIPTKIILEKIIKNKNKNKKNMWGNTVAIHNVLKKKITKLNSHLA
jgi:hypothetical protein